MNDRMRPVLSCALLWWIACTGSALQAATPPPAGTAPQARTALGFNLVTRCPAVRIAGEDDKDVALVLFLVGASGVPSKPSVTAPSGSKELDTAAVSCVLKLRFQPATRVGEGTAVESWQQIALKWAPAARAPAAISAAAQGATAPPPDTHASAAAPRAAEVQVCVDPSGKLTGEPKLTHASGDPQFDAAAVSVARSGSGYYRPASVGGKAAPGCVRVTITAGEP